MPSRTIDKQVKKARRGAEKTLHSQQDRLQKATEHASDRAQKAAERASDRAQKAAGHAGERVQRAAEHARDYATDEFVPAAKHAYEHRVKPRVEAAGKAGQFVGGAARDAAVGGVLPAFTSIATAAAALAEEGSKRLAGGSTDFSKSAGKAAKQLKRKTRGAKIQGTKGRVKLKVAGKAAKHAARAHGVLPKQRSGIGAGGVVGIVLGVVAVSAIGYAVWQTLRADDDLWVADDDAEQTPPSNSEA